MFYLCSEFVHKRSF